MGNAALAYLAGLVTILNPCVLPILPILLGSALGQSRYGPAALAAGLVLSFSTFGLLIVAFGYSIGLSEQLLRNFAAALLVAAGLFLLLPPLQSGFTALTAPLVSGGNRLLARVAGDGLAGQFAIGTLLGLVWAPCVGPTLGVAIAAASRGEDLPWAFAIFLVFGGGVATSMLALAYGSRQALGTRRARVRALAPYARPVFGGLLIVVGGIILGGLDKSLEAWLLAIMPQWLIVLTTRF